MEKNRLLEKVTKNSEMQNQLATSVVTGQKSLSSPECYFLMCYSSFPLLGLLTLFHIKRYCILQKTSHNEYIVNLTTLFGSSKKKKKEKKKRSMSVIFNSTILDDLLRVNSTGIRLRSLNPFPILNKQSL